MGYFFELQSQGSQVSVVQVGQVSDDGTEVQQALLLGGWLVGDSLLDVIANALGADHQL